MGIAILIGLFIAWRVLSIKTERESKRQQAKIENTLKEAKQNLYESEYMEMEMFLEEECCLGSLIADYYDAFDALKENPTMTKREYYENEMIKHGILDVYQQWKEEILPQRLEELANEDK